MNTLDRYEILGELGRGAVSRVYDARDLLTDHPVALKLIESSLWVPPTSAAERLRFLAEATPGWRLRHPNIVRVYDAGDSNGRLYVAMERLEGRILRRVLDESPWPDVPRSLRMAAELASGLAHAHERGVVHRYLKPSNIFVFADGRAKITDFGMAPLRDAAVASLDCAACLGYVSPEEIRRDEAIDGRSDIFSLGVVLYEMLTGKRPFGGDSSDEIMWKVQEAEPPLPSELNGAVPPMVDLLVWSMLAKTSFSRAPSAEILARRLWRLCEQGDAVHAGDEVAVAETTDEHASGDAALTVDHQSDVHTPSAEILIFPVREADGALAAHAGDEVTVAETTDERASGDAALTVDHQSDMRTPSAEILVFPIGEPRAEPDGMPAAHAADEIAVAETTDERESGDAALTVDHQSDVLTPSAEILVHPVPEPREQASGVPATHPGEEVAIAETADEHASSDAALTVDHQSDVRTPSAEIAVHPVPEPGEQASGAPATHPSEEVAIAETADERASGDAALTLDRQSDGRTPSAEIIVHPVSELREEVRGMLAAHAWETRVATAAETTLRPKLRIPRYVLTAVIFAAAGSAFLLQWWQSSDSSEVASAISGGTIVTALTTRPSIPDEPRPSVPAPEPEQAASEPEPTAAASAPEPTKAESVPQPKKVASAPEPKKVAAEPERRKRLSKAPAKQPSRLVAVSSTPAPQAEPSAVPLAVAPLPAPPPPPVKTATLVFDVSPWGEIYVDGKLHGTTPPLRAVALPPGRHRVEVRRSAQPPYLSYLSLEPGDVRSIRHQFE